MFPLYHCIVSCALFYARLSFKYNEQLVQLFIVTSTRKVIVSVSCHNIL